MKVLRLTLAGLVFPFALSAQTLVDLAFNNPVEGTNITGSGPSGAAYTGTTYNFLNVAPGYDMRATISSFGNVTFLYSYPNYSSAAGEPSGDLGYRYQATSVGQGGLNYKLDFFESGGTFSTAKILPDLALMIYDVDGEASQDESVRVYLSDGFYGFRMPTAGGATTFANEGSSFRFTGPGSNRNEDDPSGAFILYFENTSSLTLQMLSDTDSSGGFPNPVFSAIDGNLSLIGKNFTNFTGIQMVPEPSVGSLLLVGMAVALRRKRRRSEG
jgi:hypothetical protein